MFSRSAIAALAAVSSLASAIPTAEFSGKFPEGFGPRPIQLSQNRTAVHPDGTSPDSAAPTFDSSNWSGIINVPASGTKFTSAVGTFKVPTCGHGASGSGPWYNAYWVGIDGYTNGNALLQAGVICEYTSSGSRTYTVWTEFFPNPLITVSNFPVSAGDSVTVKVNIINPTKGSLIVSDSTNGHAYTTTVSAPAATNKLTGSSAEWITEDFSSNGGLVPFASFSPVTWTASTAKEANGGTIDAYTSGYTNVVLENNAGTAITSTTENGITGLITKYTGAT